MSASKFACPCCGFLTLDEPGEWEICPVCFWEDDPVQTAERTSHTGANKCSLLEARQNFMRMGACEEHLKAFVRAPLPEEIP